MRVLVDTQCWLWSVSAPGRLNQAARTLFEERRHPLYLSAASSWEMAIKVALGALRLPEPPARFVPARLAEDGIDGLPVEHAHALYVANLPPAHGDPFDRILVAQALVERMTVLTADASFALYDVPLVWAGEGLQPKPPRRRRARTK